MLKKAIKLAIAGTLLVSATSAQAFFSFENEKSHSYVEKTQCYGNILHVGDISGKPEKVKVAGKNVVLQEAVRAIAPTDWTIVGGETSNKLVSWKKGMPWHHTLWHIVNDSSACVTLNWNNKTVYLNNTDFNIEKNDVVEVESVKKHKAAPATKKHVAKQLKTSAQPKNKSLPCKPVAKHVPTPVKAPVAAPDQAKTPAIAVPTPVVAKPAPAVVPAPVVAEPAPVVAKPAPAVAPAPVVAEPAPVVATPAQTVTPAPVAAPGQL